MMGPEAFNTGELLQLLDGQRLELAGGLYAMCSKCRRVVQLNKRFLGSLHLCTLDEKSESEEENDDVL